MTNSTPQHAAPTETPNVVIENPAVRKGLRTVLDVVGAVAFLAAVADVWSPAFDISGITVPALAVYTAARTVFGFAVDSPNTPKA